MRGHTIDLHLIKDLTMVILVKENPSGIRIGSMHLTTGRLNPDLNMEPHQNTCVNVKLRLNRNPAVGLDMKVD